MPSYFTSLTTPTTVVHGQVVQPPSRNRLPTALSFGKNRRAHARSTITDNSASAAASRSGSRSSSKRPSTSVRPSVRTYSGVTATQGVTGCDCAGRRRVLLEIEVVVLAGGVGRQSIRERHRGHAGQRLRSALQLIPERVDARVVPVERARQPDRAGQHLCRLEAKVDLPQAIEAGEQQGRDDQQRRRDRELRRDETAAKTTDAGAAGHGSPGSQRGVHGSAGRVQRRNEAEDQRARDREPGHQPDHRRIEADLLRARKIRGALRLQQLHAGPRHADAERHRAGREHRALGQQVTQHASARGAERGADGKLLPAAGHARDQQVRGIRARDQPHQADGGQREAGQRADVADQVGLQVLHVPRRLVVLVRRFPDREQRAVDRMKLARSPAPRSAPRGSRAITE